MRRSFTGRVIVWSCLTLFHKCTDVVSFCLLGRYTCVEYLKCSLEYSNAMLGVCEKYQPTGLSPTPLSFRQLATRSLRCCLTSHIHLIFLCRFYSHLPTLLIQSPLRLMVIGSGEFVPGKICRKNSGLGIKVSGNSWRNPNNQCINFT